MTSSMMAESEEGASQLQPLECTAAEANLVIEDMSRKLMVGAPSHNNMVIEHSDKSRYTSMHDVQTREDVRHQG